MKVVDLYKVLNEWTDLTIYDVFEKKTIFNGMAMELEIGEKHDNCENILYDSRMGEILQKTIADVIAKGDNEITIEVI